MKYRKKPVIVEAWHPGYEEAPAWALQAITEKRLNFRRDKSIDSVWLEVKTLEGSMRADNDDYIIKGIKGEIYPCKSDIFEATYEPVKENGE